MPRLSAYAMARPDAMRRMLLLGALLLPASPAAAQQCLGGIPTAQTRAAFVQDAARSASAAVDRARVMLPISRAMALTTSAARHSYFEAQEMPWKADGMALQLTVEGPSAGARRVLVCPMVEVSGLRSTVANWGTPHEWKLTRFAPGLAAGWAHAVRPDLTLIPFVAGSLVIEGFETVQPSTARETRSYAVLDFGTGVVMFKVLALRLAVSVPVGRRDGYPGPYTMRALSAGVSLPR